MFHIGKDRVDLDSFAAFLTQPDTVEFAHDGITIDTFFWLYAAWVRSRAERPSVSYTKVVMEVAWTGHNLQFTKTN